ncbi:bifunctional DNA primase/polymerase [Streptomyces sp. NPDC055085]
MTLLPYALTAAQQGWAVFPINPAGTRCPESGDLIDKHPHLLWPGKPYKTKWGEAATTDLNQIIKWWTASPDANIGIAAKPSGLLVIDCDMPKKPNQLRDTPWGYLHEKLGPLVDGADVLREMCSRFGDDYSRLERTYRVCTASMGLHLYFRWPEGVQASQASPVPGLVDVRCNGGQQGGYVLGAGSKTHKGEYVAENDVPVAAAPPWLIELCRDKPRPKPVYQSSLPGREGSFGGLAAAVRSAAEGSRNSICHWAACCIRDDGATEETAIETLVPAGVEAGLSESEITATIRSAYRKG